MRDLATLYAFNRGLVSPLALARQDLKRMALSAETQTNWMPRVMGAMSLRPGSVYLQPTRNNAASVTLPFVFATDDTALVELTDQAMRVVLDDAVISRVAVTATVADGDFAALTAWVDVDEAGTTSALSGGQLSLHGNGTASAGRSQLVALGGSDSGKEHALAVSVTRGTVTLKVGSTLGGEEFLAAMTLRTGHHSIAFTPTASFYVRLTASDTTAALVASVHVEAAGSMAVSAPWLAADLQRLRYDQSGDVIFVACGGHRQRRIERQALRSWSIVEYLAEDGPFRNQNTTPTTMSVNVLTGTATLTASKPTFKSTNVGSLYRLASAGQTVTATISAQDTWTDPIRVTGITAGRIFLLSISTIGTSTVTLQRSVGEPGDWTDVVSYTANTTVNYDDTFDNQIIYYRLGVKTGNYVSPNAPYLEIAYAAGSIEGIGVVTAYTSSTVVTVDVLKSFGSTSATSTWWEGSWSDRRGWPSAVVLYDGRLWWAGQDKIDGSVSDAFDSFADSVIGDSGPIKRSIGSGPVDTINWLLPLGSLLVGTQGSELVAKASSLDEPLTPTAFSLKPVSTLGSADMPALRVDTTGVYVQRDGSRVYELAMDGATYSYASHDLTATAPELGGTGFVRMAAQRQPDTRIHFVRGDGKVAILVSDRVENVTCWVTYETDGVVEDVVVLPGPLGDRVYYTVKRVINGSTVRYRERWAYDSEIVGAADTVLTDCSLVYSGASTAVITGLGHLEGATVAVWGNSKDLGTHTVASGAITLSEAVTWASIGLPYTATFKSARMALGSATGNPLTQRKRLDHVGLVLANTHAQGLRYGQDTAYLDDLPLIEQGATVDAGKIWDVYAEDSVELNGTWSTDTRLCLEAASPRPCTVLACVVAGAGHDKV